jgi:hypothetical protein
MKYPPGCRVATAMRRIIQCKRVLWELKFSVQGRPSKSLNHEGAGRSRFFEVKQFEYTLFEGILLRGDAAIKTLSHLLKLRKCGDSRPRLS